MTVTTTYDSVLYVVEIVGHNVSITAGNEWAGNGVLLSNGRIEDCAAVLPDGAYEAIEQAIAESDAGGAA